SCRLASSSLRAGAPYIAAPPPLQTNNVQSGRTVATQGPGTEGPLGSKAPSSLGLVDVVGGREGAGAHLVGIGLDRCFDLGGEAAVALDEFRDPRAQPKH